MNRRHSAALVALLLILASARDAGAAAPSATASQLAGVWSGTMTHEGRSEAIAIDLEAAGGDTLGVRLSIPVVHLDRIGIGRFVVAVHGDSVRLGPFRFTRDRLGRTLFGVMPAGLVPVYDVPMRLMKSASFAPPSRQAIDAPDHAPSWTFDAGSPLWAGPVYADGAVYAGAEDGRVFALDARTGAERWTFRAGGAVRTRPAVNGNVLYVQSDDGLLYARDSRDGTERWTARIVDGPVVRLPFSDPKSRYDRFGSDVTVAGDRLYVGTHDGRLLALDAADGRILWSFGAGDAVLAAPLVRDGRVTFGSYDRFVYALDAADGRLLWKRDTGGAVVSTPAFDSGRVIVGNRCYDLLAFDAATGEVAWKQYVWMSWIESSATIRDGVVFVGSSDAAAVFAFDAATGGRLWAADVHGWAWGQPAMAGETVYAGTSGQVGYPVTHEGALVALDRSTGAVRWRHVLSKPESGAFGIPGSPAVGVGLVFAGGLDGRLYAIPE